MPVEFPVANPVWTFAITLSLVVTAESSIIDDPFVNLKIASLAITL
jgi:hypothetical protein